MTDVITLASDLIRCPSITPRTAGVFDVIEDFLVPLGFNAMRQTFGEGDAAVENIYLRFGTEAPNFCFAGHTDVVPVGDVSQWNTPAFAPEVIDGELIGRGAEDMKGAIAAFMIAARDFIAEYAGDTVVRSAAREPLAAGVSAKREGDKVPFRGSISFLITQDEEGPALHGTRPMLAWLAQQGETIDAALVGEPTNRDTLGDMAKVGRRGSVYFHLTVQGKQGHVAYPERADNPIPRRVAMLHALKAEPLDEGTEFFPPSNLEITTVDVGNPTGNVIPASAQAHFNVRFNNLHTGASLEEWVRKRCGQFGEYTLTTRVTGDAFLNKDEKLTAMLVEAVQEVTGHTPILSTTGGTSDARFIKDYCPVIEFGTTGRTPHMVNERVEVATLLNLAKIYEAMLKRYFAA